MFTSFILNVVFLVQLFFYSYQLNLFVETLNLNWKLFSWMLNGAWLVKDDITPLAQKRSLILMRSRFMGAAREISKFHNWSLLINSQHCCICLAEIMSQGVKLYSINQSHTRDYFCHWRIFRDGGSFGHLWNYGGCGRCNLWFCRPKIKTQVNI